MDDSDDTDADPSDNYTSPLAPARSFLLYHDLGKAPGPRISIPVELACRGPLTPSQLNESPLLEDVSLRRIYELLNELDDEGMIEKEFVDASTTCYRLVAPECDFSHSG